jgi:hypothetical protein
MPDTTERLTLEEALAMSVKLQNATGIKTKRDNPEDRIQIAFFEWVYKYEDEWHLLKRVRADRAGVNIASAAARIKMQKMGGRRGVWDVYCDIPYTKCVKEPDNHIVVTHCPGLYIEMKSKDGRLTEDQIAFRRDRLFPSSYRFAVCRSALEGAIAVRDYLELVDERYANLPLPAETDN